MTKVQPFSFHTHTTFSDGRSTIDEMLSRAVQLGWQEIAITDHFEVGPTVQSTNQFLNKSFVERLPQCQQHIRDIKAAAANYPLKVYAGFEVDFFTTPGWLEDFRAFRKLCGADFYHTGNHNVVSEDHDQAYPVLFLREYIDPIQHHDYFVRHFETMRAAVLSGEFLFLAHIDFARWGGDMQDGQYQEQIMSVIEALAKTGMATELNTKGMLTIGDYYPSPWILKELKAHNVPIVISDDAHHTDQMGRYFAEAEVMLDAIGYKNRWKLEL